MRALREGREAEDDDAALVAAARADPRAFAPLYERYFDRVHAYCLRRVPGREAAADATAQVFLKALAALPTYRPVHAGTFRSWLFAIAHNACIDALRRHRPHADLADIGEVPGIDPSPEDHAIAADGHRSVAALLAHLTPDQRRVVELRLAGLTGQEVAATLDLTLPAVKAAQFRAYVRLRRLLAAGDIPTRPEDADAPR